MSVFSSDYLLIDNGNRLITVGAFTATLNFTATTNVTFPASGTLATVGGDPLTVTTETGSFSAGSSTHNTIYVITPSGDTAVGTLPAASAVSTGFTILFKNNTDGKDVTIARAGSDTIDGLTSYRVPGRSVVAVTRVSSSAWIVTQTPEAPVGTIRNWGVTQAHPGWVSTDGILTLSRSTYSGLFAEWSTNFGAGNGTTTFGIPDLSRAIGGMNQGNDVWDIGGNDPGGFGGTGGYTIGATGGEAAHTLTANVASSGTGEQGEASLASGTAIADASGAGNFAADSIGIGPASTAHNTIHPTILLNRIIKT